VAKAEINIPWLPMCVIVSRVARHLGCTSEDAKLRILREAEARGIKACGLTADGWPVSPLRAAWRAAIDWDLGQLSCEVTNVELRLDDLIAAGLLPAAAAAEGGRWPAATALAYRVEGVPFEWKEWLHWRLNRGLSEMGPLIKPAGIDIARAIAADQVLAWGRLSPHGPMEQISGSDLRVPGFVWVVQPDGDLGADPPHRLVAFQGRRWKGIEVDLGGFKRAFPKPLSDRRSILHEAEQLYTEGGAKPAEVTEIAGDELAEAEPTRWQRDRTIAAIKTLHPPDGIRPKGVSIAALTNRINKLPEFKENQISEDTVGRALEDIKAALKK
jgi:hypothetical protein